MGDGGAKVQGNNFLVVPMVRGKCLGFYVPPTEGGGGILVLVQILSASASSSASALLRFRALSFEPMDVF